MVSSSFRRAITCIFLVVSVAVCVRAQVATEKTGSASVSGKVTAKGKALPGIVVMASDPNYGGSLRSRYRARSDDAGNYHINLPPGTYQIVPVLLSWVLENQSTNNAIVVSDGENVEGFDLSLVKGGVITGKVTDADGKPLVDEMVSVMPVDSGMSGSMVYSASGRQTDDRGIYRAFGLQPGKYKVSIGQARGPLMGQQRVYRQTFYPSVADYAKATVVEVGEGNEVTDIDIVVGRPIKGFRVQGRIVDGETGNPLPNLIYGVARTTEGGQESTSGNTTNARGEFRFDNAMPGKYFVFVASEGRSNVRSDSLSFEVTDHDITDLVLKTSSGSTISGVVVFEGMEEKTAAPNRFSDLYLHSWTEDPRSEFGGMPSSQVKPDGSFQLVGLRGGLTHFGLSTIRRNNTRTLSVVRIEREGIVQPGGITVKDGEQVTNVRLVVKYLSGTIRGQIKIEGSDAVPAGRMSVWVTLMDNGGGQRMMSQNSAQVDSRGRFLLEGLAAGTYEINVAVFESGRYDTNQVYKQQVTVTDNTVSEVTITLKPIP